MDPLDYQPGGSPPPVAGEQPPPGLLAKLGQLFRDGEEEAAAPPNPYADHKAIKAFVEECKKDALQNRWVYERTWWRVLLYLLGRQWVYYDRKRGQWMDKRMAKWIPRPVTNIVGTALDAIRTVFQAVQLQTTARPLTSDPDAVATAETVDRIEPLIAQEHQMKQVLTEWDFWFVTLGEAVLQLWWDPDAKKKLVQYQACTGCQGQYHPEELEAMGPAPMCEVCGGAEFEPAVDAFGQPVGEEVVEGAARTDPLSPFEYATASGYTRFRDSPLVLRMRWRTKKWCEDNYEPEQIKGVVWGRMPHERSMQLLRAIATQSDVASTPITYSGDDGGESEGTTEYELWHKPCRKYPRGLVARVLGDSNGTLIVKEDEGLPGPLPYLTNDGMPLFPFAHASYETLGGRIHGRGALEKGLSKQDQLNQLDSMAALTEQRMANPVWLEPKGAEVKSFTGEPGLVVKYNPNVAGGNAKPERIPGQNIPNSLFTRREQIKADAEEIWGTYDILKGAKPTGVEAFAALNLLVERSQSRFGPALASRGEAYREWFTMALEIERQFGPAERIRAIMKPNRSWTFKKFEKAKLQGSVDIIVEDGSQLPKTALGKRAAIEHGNQLGVLNPGDAEQQWEIMREIGIGHLAPSLDASVKGALREHTLFERWTSTLPVNPNGGPTPLVAPMAREQVAPVPVEVEVQPTAEPGGGGEGGDEASGQPQTQTQMVSPPPAAQASILFPGNPLKVRPWDKHLVHLAQHDIWCQSDEALEMFARWPELEELWALHRQAHMMAQAEEATQQVMMQGAAMPTPQGASLGLKNSNQNAKPVPAQSPQAPVPA